MSRGKVRTHCKDCGRVKNYRNNSYCKLCANARAIKSKYKNIVMVRERDKEYQAEKRRKTPGFKAIEALLYSKKSPEKISAHHKVFYAVKKGFITRSTCEVCGNSKVHAHHEKYSEPLAVRWLCPLHHMQLHKTLVTL